MSDLKSLEWWDSREENFIMAEKLKNEEDLINVADGIGVIEESAWILEIEPLKWH